MSESRGRPPLTLGTYGNIKVTATKSKSYTALARYRDLDGETRKVTATGRTKREATDKLIAKLKERARGHDDVLTPKSTIADLARVWLKDHEASPGTKDQYQGTIDRHIIPKIGGVRVRELTPSLADRFLKDVGTKHAGTVKKSNGEPVTIGGATAAKVARAVLTQMMGMAVRYELCETNPVREARAPKSTRNEVRALSADELQDLIDDVREWSRAGQYGPERDQDIADMIEVFIGTGMRPGELLGLRFSDGVDLGEKPRVFITGTVKRTKEQGLFRQDHPKTDSSDRGLYIPAFVAAVLRRRKLASGGVDFVFPNRDGEMREPSNFNRVWRSARGDKWDWVVPKSFRAAVATIIDRESDSEHAASQLGHTNDSITRRHYIQRDKTAKDNTEILARFREAQ